MITVVSYTDPNKTPIELDDGSRETLGTLTLFGTGYTEYGEELNENFLHLLENFSTDNPNGIPDPIEGQTIFDEILNLTKVYDGSVLGNIGEPWVQETAPPMESYRLWTVPSTQYTYVNVNEQWVSVADRYLDKSGGHVTGTVNIEGDVISNGPVFSPRMSVFNQGTFSEYANIVTDNINLNDLGNIDFNSRELSSDVPLLLGADNIIANSMTVSVTSVEFNGTLNLQTNDVNNLIDVSDPSSAVTIDYLNSRSASITQLYLLKDGSNQMSGLLEGGQLSISSGNGQYSRIELLGSPGLTIYSPEDAASANDSIISFQNSNHFPTVYPLFHITDTAVGLSAVTSFNSLWKDVSDPVNLQDAANKRYVDNLLGNIEQEIPYGGKLVAAGIFRPDGQLVVSRGISYVIKVGSEYHIGFSSAIISKLYTVVIPPFTQLGQHTIGTEILNPNFYTTRQISRDQAQFRIEILQNATNTSVWTGRWGDSVFEFQGQFRAVPTSTSIEFPFFVFSNE